MGISHSLINEVATGSFAAILSPTGELVVAASATELENELSASFFT